VRTWEEALHGISMIWGGAGLSVRTWEEVCR
jgi:hypothetical protein